MSQLAGAPVAGLASALAEVRRRIVAAGGGDRVTIVGVTKNHPAESCLAALRLGLFDLGENRVQEALRKREELAALLAAEPGPARPEAVRWHLIGPLQLNKVRHAAGRFDLIHTVDSVRLAEAIARRAPEQAVLIQVNISDEPQKHGCPPDAAVELAVEVARRLDLRGFMGLGAAGRPAGPGFQRLRLIREAAEQRLGRPLPVLSMGMSADLEEAVREGSTLVRVGTLLFGPRPEPAPAGR